MSDDKPTTECWGTSNKIEIVNTLPEELVLDNSEVDQEKLDKDNWKSSEAYVKCDRGGNTSSASPTIEITESTIWVYHSQSGGGSVKHTKLRGSGGNYIFAKPGRKNVNPGTYDHIVKVYIGCPGWAASGIRYK